MGADGAGCVIPGRHLLRSADLRPEDVRTILRSAADLKRQPWRSDLAGRIIVLLFQKPSLRTRVSFDVGIRQLGGQAIYLAPEEVGMGRREPVQDVARVLGRYVDGIVARVFAQADIEDLARYAGVPVVNGLSDAEHPCQALADCLTIAEHRPCLAGQRIAFLGDGNNVAASLAVTAAALGCHITIASPPDYALPEEVLETARAMGRQTGAQVAQTLDPAEAARGADVLYTDVWTSMGQEAETEQRRLAFEPYQLNRALVELAQPDALIMHDLPAHRGEEITDDVFESPRSVIFDQAENRLHAQKAALLFLFND